MVQALMHNRISDANRGASWRRARCWFARDGDVIVRGVDLDGRTARFAHELLLDHRVTLAGERRATWRDDERCERSSGCIPSATSTSSQAVVRPTSPQH